MLRPVGMEPPAGPLRLGERIQRAEVWPRVALQRAAFRQQEERLQPAEPQREVTQQHPAALAPVDQRWLLFR